MPRPTAPTSRGPANPAADRGAPSEPGPTTRPPYVDEGLAPRQPFDPPVGRGVGPPRGALVAAAILAAVAALALGMNLTGFPYHENDEGTYVAQAWAVTSLGRLAPYTYTYDHAPLGWLTIAAWTTILGGSQRFGTAVDTGRALMLLVQVASTVLVFGIGLRLSGRVWVGLLAGALFALAPVGLYYHRRVLLDNPATLWLLLGIWLLLPRPGAGGTVTAGPSTVRVVAGGLAFGAAVLTKEVALATLPALALLAARPMPGRGAGAKPSRGSSRQVSRSRSTRSAPPFEVSFCRRAGWDLDPPSGVSLVGGLTEQLARGRDGGLLSPSSAIWEMLGRWAREEPLLVLGGTVAAIWLATRWRRSPAASSIGLAVLCLWVFLGRGGIVLPFYLVPLLPLLALSLALALAPLPGLVSNRSLARAMPTLIVAAGLLLLLPGLTSPTLGFDGNPLSLWTNRQADRPARGGRLATRQRPDHQQDRGGRRALAGPARGRARRRLRGRPPLLEGGA